MNKLIIQNGNCPDTLRGVCTAPARPQRQYGVALVVSLLILLIMTLLGVTAMQNSAQQERMASNTRQHDLAFQAAEAQLRAGESALSGAPVLSSTVGTPNAIDNCTQDITTCWSEQFGASCQNGLSVLDQIATVGAASGGSDQATGGNGSLQAGAAQLVGNGVVTGSNQQFLYRVTACGTGANADSMVILQSFYVK